ncbi:MAG: hypothetical protein SO434_01010 [Eubacteriales bacterium]|nr:hypothetical protein [Eubacteriales bacterium]
MTDKYKYSTMVVAIVLILSLAGAVCCFVLVEKYPSTPSHGMAAVLAVDVGGSNGLILAKATNEFCLGTTRLQIRLKLYGSDYQAYKVEDMTLVDVVEKFYLDIGENVYVVANTEGKTRYWCAVVEYKHDDKPWKTCSTAIIAFDGQGKECLPSN